MAAARLSGSMKTAIVLFSLGEEVATSIFRFLEPRDIQRIRDCLPELERVPPGDIAAVIREFNDLAQSEHLVGSQDYFKRLLSKAVGDKKAEAMVGGQMNSGDRFELLGSIDEKAIARFLSNEHPQTAALVVAHMQPRQAATVMKLLPERMRSEIIVRISTLEPVAPEVLDEVSDMICRELQESSGVKRREIGGVETAAEILNQLDKASEESIFSAVEEFRSDLAEEIRKRMFVFEDLVHIDGLGIQAVLKEVHNEELIMALKSASEGVKELFFKNMSERAAEMLREDLEALGPVRLSDVERAQQNVIQVARRLEDEGKIIISRGATDDVIL